MKKEHIISFFVVVIAIIFRITLTDDFVLYHHTSFSFFSGIIGIISVYTKNKTIRSLFLCSILYIVFHQLLVINISYYSLEFYLHLIHFIPFIICVILKRFSGLGVKRILGAGIFDSVYIFIYGLILEDYNFRMKEFIGDSSFLLFFILLFIGLIPSGILGISLLLKKKNDIDEINK